MPLSEKYFQRVVAEDAPQFDQYICKFPTQTVVCFSGATMTPIMAVTLRPVDQPALVTRRDPPAKDATTTQQQYFQGLLNCDNCEFQFVVSNLTRGNLCFHIVEAGDEKPCNLVNTLRGLSTYEIPCDKRTQRAMILTALKNAATGTMVTMAEAEEKAAPGKPGSLEFQFVCYGESNTNGALFAEKGPTQWIVVPGFVVAALPKPQPMFRGGFGGSNDRNIRLERRQGISENRPSRSSGGAKDSGYNDRRGGPPPKGKGSSFSGSKSKPNQEEEVDVSGNEGLFDEPAMIKSSYAGRLVHGDKEIHETSQTIYGLEFDYEKPSTRMAMILSVWLNGIPPNLMTRDATLEYLAEQVQLRIGARYEALLKQIPQVFTADECVVTMEPVDTVIATCGHACLNHTAADAEKLKHKCPVCRGFIVGFIPLANLSV